MPTGEYAIKHNERPYFVQWKEIATEGETMIAVRLVCSQTGTVVAHYADMMSVQDIVEIILNDMDHFDTLWESGPELKSPTIKIHSKKSGGGTLCGTVAGRLQVAVTQRDVTCTDCLWKMRS